MLKLKKLTLKELRNLCGKTQSELATVIDKSVGMYSMIESGKRKLSLEDAIKIAEFYKIAVEEINFFENNINTVLNN